MIAVLDRRMLQRAKYFNIHAILRRHCLESVISGSLEEERAFLVSAPADQLQKLERYIVRTFPSHVKVGRGDVVDFSIEVCFENRSSGYAAKLSEKEALYKLLARAGLSKISPDSVSCSFLKDKAAFARDKKKFDIMNTFRVEGRARVDDLERFMEAIEKGVGKRKSYGFGLLMARKVGSQKTA